jgi:hypothetical protein
MRGPAFLVATCAILAAPMAGWARSPVVIELYTAQGCSSCDKADEMIAGLADRPGVVALTWPVDYWDYLGWKDTFAKPEFARRQRLYDRHFGVRDVYTPQVVVGGGAQVSGADPAAVERLIREARRAPANAPDMKLLASGRVAVGSGPRPKGGGEVWLIRFDPRRQQIEVKEGDNRGQTVVQRNVVRQADRLGRWVGKPVNFAAPAAAEDGLVALILVQSEDGKILAADQAPAPSAPPAKP